MAADLWLLLAMIESCSASEASEIALLGLIMLLSSPPTSLKLEDLSSDVNGNKYLASPRHNWEPSLRQGGGISKGPIKSFSSPAQRTFRNKNQKQQRMLMFLILLRPIVLFLTVNARHRHLEDLGDHGPKALKLVSSYPQTPVERSRHILLAASHQLDRCTQEPRVNGSGYAAPSRQSSRLDPGKNHLITSLPSRHELAVSSFHLKRLQHNSQAESQQSSRA
ncbi:hypothetical protein Bca4012_030721 [Brassica carinata]